MTSSTCSGDSRARSMAARTAMLPSCVAVMDLRTPWNLPIGVRTALRITGSFIVGSRIKKAAECSAASILLKKSLSETEVDQDAHIRRHGLAVFLSGDELPFLHGIYGFLIETVAEALSDVLELHSPVSVHDDEQFHGSLNTSLAAIVGILRLGLR